jgi:hypothetical protein
MDPEQPRPGIGGTLTMKLGPLPVWAWVLIAIIGYWIYSKKKAASSSTSNNAGDSSAVYNASGQQIGTLTTSVQTTPILDGDTQTQGRGGHWDASNNSNTQLAQTNPSSDSLSSNGTDGTAPDVNVTTPATS